MMGSSAAFRVLRRTAVVTGVVSVVAAGGALAVSAVTEDEPVPLIHACVSHGVLGIGKGTIRIVDSPSRCSSNEDSLIWNQRGIQGPVGPQGVIGPQGPVGPQGEQGIEGPEGKPGQQGDPGLPGQPGRDGMQGPRGPAGISGYETVSKSNDIVRGAFIQTRAICPEGKVVLGGGVGIFYPELQMWEHGPFGNNSWAVTFRNNGSVTRRVTVTATCAAIN